MTSRPFPTDLQTIRSFIMYDALAERDPFDGYKTFCKVIGRPDYDYVEYEFWYYRFYHGSLDLHYDPNSLDLEKKPKFDDLPNEVLVGVVEQLDVKSRLTTQKVSRKLRLLSTQKSSEIRELEISVIQKEMEIVVDGNHLIYEKQQDDDQKCLLYNHFKKTQISENYLNLALADLSSILEIPRTPIRNLSICLENEAEGNQKLLEKMQEIAARKSSKFHVKSAFFRTENGENLMRFLEILKPGTLESFHIGNEEIRNLNDLLGMEQFKRAKNVDLSSVGVVEFSKIERFSNFEKFKIQIQAITATGIATLRDQLLGSAAFQKCEINVLNVINHEEIRRSFGGGNDDGREFEFRFLAPNLKEALRFWIRFHFIVIEKMGIEKN